jgi:hypothetical protein
MTQINKREIGELEAVGYFEPEGASVEVERSCFIEDADH